MTNIISELKNGLEDSDLEWIRELAVQLKKEGTTLAEFASIYRHHNYIKELGATEDQIESLIVNLLNGTRSIPIERTADVMNMLYELSESESIPPTEVPDYVKRRVEEKTKLTGSHQFCKRLIKLDIIRDKSLENWQA